MNEQAPTPVPVEDLNAATFCMLRSCRLVSTRQNGKRVEFLFADPARVETALLEFLNNPSVSLREWLSTYRELKAVMFAARKGGQ